MNSMMSGGSVLVEVFWKSGVILGAALCLNVLLRSKSADLRRLVLSTAIVALFVAAVASPALPRWTAVTPAWLRIPVPPAPIASEPTLAAEMPASNPDPPSLDSRPVASYPHFGAWLPDHAPSPISVIWFAVALLMLTRFAVSLRSLRRLRNVSDSVTDADLLTFPDKCRRRVVLLQNETIAAPATWGIVRPVIVVPAAFEQLPTESRSAVFSHELAHIQAHDFFMRVLAEIARALLWFQPLVWIAWRQLREEQELACDNRVLASGGKPSAYAKLLLDWGNGSPARDVLVAVGMAHRSCLNRRLFALLDQDMQRDAVSITGVLTACLFALGAALPLAAVSFTSPLPAARVSHVQPSARIEPKPMILAQLQPQQAPASAAPKTPADSAKDLEFEVATVKPFDASNGFFPNMRGGPGTSDPDRISFTSTLKGFLMAAYGVGNEYISGPAWLDTNPQMYAIAATIRPGATKDQVNQMLRNLLNQRFQITMHRETRDVPLYELTLAGKAPQLKEYVPNSYDDDKGAARPAGGGPYPAYARGFPEGLDLPYQYASDGISHAVANKVPMAQLIKFLSLQLKRPVVDKTGLTGLYSYNLDFMPFLPGAGEDLSSAAAPDFVTAVRVQLGMKLTAKKGPIEIIVIDHAEKTPIEN